MRYRLTSKADRDVSQILADSYSWFGERQFNRYVELIETSMTRVAENPGWAISKDRTDLGAGVRSLHLQHVAKRSGGASHIVYYRALPAGAEASVVILRVLGDRMEPSRRVRSALRDEERN